MPLSYNNIKITDIWDFPPGVYEPCMCPGSR